MQIADSEIAILSNRRDALIGDAGAGQELGRGSIPQLLARAPIRDGTAPALQLPSSPGLSGDRNEIMDLGGKTVVVTGAARGLGAAIARGLAERGARLALLDLDEDSLAQTLEGCSAASSEARAYAANVADETQVEKAFTAINEHFGSIAALINNAGILRDGLLVKAKDGEISSRLSLDDWRAVIDVNLTGVFLCGRELISPSFALTRSPSRRMPALLMSAAIPPKCSLIAVKAFSTWVSSATFAA